MDSSDEEYDAQPVASTSTIPAAADVSAPVGKGGKEERIKRKSGKKGKKFVEDTGSLLALISEIAGEKEGARADKLQRTAKNQKETATAVKTKAQRKLDRTAPLRATKKLLLEKDQEKKAKRKALKKGPVEVPSSEGKKRKTVSFGP